MTAGPREPGGTTPHDQESLAEVLASIRALVSAETEARTTTDGDTVLMLTSEMRALRTRPGDVLAEGIDAPDPGELSAPILDEESLREVVNAIVREELQGELGERIGRNLRKLIRREVALILEEQRKS